LVGGLFGRAASLEPGGKGTGLWPRLARRRAPVFRIEGSPEGGSGGLARGMGRQRPAVVPTPGPRGKGRVRPAGLGPRGSRPFTSSPLGPVPRQGEVGQFGRKKGRVASFRGSWEGREALEEGRGPSGGWAPGLGGGRLGRKEPVPGSPLLAGLGLSRASLGPLGTRVRWWDGAPGGRGKPVLGKTEAPWYPNRPGRRPPVRAGVPAPE